MKTYGSRSMSQHSDNVELKKRIVHAKECAGYFQTVLKFEKDKPNLYGVGLCSENVR